MAQNMTIEKMPSFGLSLAEEFEMGIRPPEMNNILKIQSVFTL